MTPPPRPADAHEERQRSSPKLRNTCHCQEPFDSVRPEAFAILRTGSASRSRRTLRTGSATKQSLIFPEVASPLSVTCNARGASPNLIVLNMHAQEDNDFSRAVPPQAVQRPATEYPPVPARQ